MNPPAAAQAITGIALTGGGKTYCSDCQKPLREGDRVGIHAYRRRGDGSWGIDRVLCPECDDRESHASRLYTDEVEARGRLAVVSDSTTGKASLVARDVTVVHESPARDRGGGE